MEPIKEGYYYHIYNRGAGRESIYWSKDDYDYFMKKYVYYMHIPIETYSWCLLKNHFHLLVRIRTFEEQELIFKKLRKEYPIGSFYGDQYHSPKPFFASRQFGHLFNSYTKFINQKKNRTGTLIEGAFKRKKIMDENHLLHIACYIHRNPVHHRFVKSYSDYPYSSFHEVIEKKKTFIEAEKLLQIFSGKENFLEAHREFQLMLGEEFYLE